MQRAKQELRSVVQQCVSLQPNREPMISLRETKNLRSKFETLQNTVDPHFSWRSDLPVVSQPASKTSTLSSPQLVEPHGVFEHNLKMAALTYQDRWNREAAEKYWYPSHLGPSQQMERVRVTTPKPKSMKRSLSKIGRTLFDIAFHQ